jgi:4-amino-4-deoxy-L-arabinose transferase-like glycosyltransferase
MIFKEKAAWKEAARIFGLSRLMILVFWYPCVTFVPMLTPAKNIVSKPCMNMTDNIRCFLLSWGHWDTVHYVDIAHYGYTILSNTVYFPFFPLLMRSVGFLFGGSTIADYAAGLILANSCFYGVLVLFYLLVSEDFGHTVAKYALAYLALAPYGLFFFIGYTESLFLLLTLAIFYFLRRGKPLDWWLAGLCGCLAALTRPTGIILIVPFLVLLPHSRPWVGWQVLNAILSMALIPAGLLTYMLYLWITKGNPLIFSAEEGLVWHHYTTFPWVGMLNAIQEIVKQGPYYVGDTSDVLLTLVPIVALIVGWKQLPLHYSLFSLMMILFVLCEPRQEEPLLSVPRYLLVAFPIFILFALWSKNRRVAWHLMIPSVLLFITHITQYAIYSWAT